MTKSLSHVIGLDDAPFPRTHKGDVLLVGAVYAGLRLDAVLSGKVRRDGANATQTIIKLISGSRFAGHLQLVMLQGIAFAGFNAVDLPLLHEALGLPVLVVMRRRPDMQTIRQTLLNHVPGGQRKWRLIERAGPVEPVRQVFVQRMGLTLADADRTLQFLAVNSHIPEPLRTAHLIAGGVTLGESRHRP
ncbi:DUF99 family protein [Methylobacter sp. Wu1]|uniref:endonuclease dU n=1 Tax=Methylobacter sp. Wu1 TaxID=3119359 RepID=UPI002F94B54E